MPHPPADFELRLARPDELPALVGLDDEAGALYEGAGMNFSFASDHPFVVDERRRWGLAIQQGHGRVIVHASGALAAFAIFAEVDGKPYLDQLSVHPECMRPGLGRVLLAECVRWAGARDLWLTTYAHLSWNAPYYARFGFEVVQEAECRSSLRAVLDAQRAALPDPEQRVAMVRPASLGPL